MSGQLSTAFDLCGTNHTYRATPLKFNLGRWACWASSLQHSASVFTMYDEEEKPCQLKKTVFCVRQQ